MLETKRVKYTRSDIEKALMEALGVHDKRSMNSWFEFMWKTQFLTQPEKDVYSLNWTKVVELELPIPEEVDPRQRRLVSGI